LIKVTISANDYLQNKGYNDSAANAHDSVKVTLEELYSSLKVTGPKKAPNSHNTKFRRRKVMAIDKTSEAKGIYSKQEKLSHALNFYQKIIASMPTARYTPE